MRNRPFVVTAAMWALVAIVLMGANQDLTNKPAVQDALVNFGYPEHPQPPAPAHHTLYPDEVTIFKGGTVTFTMHGMGHGIAIYPVSKNTTRAHIGSTLTSGGSQVRYRFAEDGRYLVICINRVHSINDWMFGFVNVVSASHWSVALSHSGAAGPLV